MAWPSSLSLPPELVFGLFPRLVCLVYAISFASLLPQVVGIAGTDGAFPVALRLTRLRQAFSPWRRLVHFPSLLWLHHSDGMLRALVVLGLVCAALGIYGGPLGWLGLFGCYVVYLSLDIPIALIFPWDNLLFELSFLSLFLPATHALPDLRAADAPAPLLVWALRILVFRVMFGFGKIKFIGATKEDRGYLYGFLVAQPLPSKLGWYLQKAPMWLLKAALLGMFIVELPVQLLVFHPDLGVLTALATTALMIGIQATGNFGYFNVAAIVACVPLLDTQTPRTLELTRLFADGAPALTNAVLCVHFLFALCSFPFNSWVAQQWHRWPLFQGLPRLLSWPVELCSFLHGFRTVHPYGIFLPHTAPAVRMVPVIEVSWDGVSYREVEYPLAPTTPTSPPRFISPHHPRNDQAVIYETFGLGAQSLIAGLASPGDPCIYTHMSGAELFMQRLLEGKSYPGLFTKKGALQAGEPPPTWARARAFVLVPTTHEERKRTGAWWRRAYVGPHASVATKRPKEQWQRVLAEPELWHPEMLVWRRRSTIQRVVEHSLRGEPYQTAIFSDAPEGLVPADVSAFFDELLPLVRTFDRADWSRMHGYRRALDERFDEARLHRFERVLGRLCVYASAKLDPLVLRRGARPLLPVKNYGRLWLLMHDVIVEGEAAYEAMLNEPLALRERCEALTLERGMFLSALFRYDAFVFEARKLRLLQSVDELYRPDSFAIRERKNRELMAKVSIFGEVPDFLRDKFAGAPYDGGFPEQYPTYELKPNGAIVLRAESVQAWEPLPRTRNE